MITLIDEPEEIGDWDGGRGGGSNQPKCTGT